MNNEILKIEKLLPTKPCVAIYVVDDMVYKLTALFDSVDDHFLHLKMKSGAFFNIPKTFLIGATCEEKYLGNLFEIQKEHRMQFEKLNTFENYSSARIDEEQELLSMYEKIISQLSQEITKLNLDKRELLKKETPLKGIDKPCGFGDMVLSCPTCEKPICNVWSSRTYKPKYCHYCGQRLDWGGDENE